MNKNYQQFLASIDKEPSLKYLKEEYPKIIQSFQEMQSLSVEQMFKIVIAAEKDFINEIDNLKNVRSQSSDRVELSRRSQRYENLEQDEQKEILYDIEHSLGLIVLQMSQNEMVGVRVKGETELPYQNSLDIIQQFITDQIRDKKVSCIMNAQWEDEINKQKVRNMELAVDNMKQLSQTTSKPNSSVYNSKLKIKRHIITIRKAITILKKQHQDMKTAMNVQFMLFKDKDFFIDELRVQNLFEGTYKTILQKVRGLDQQRLNKDVRFVLKQSKQLNSYNISDAIQQLCNKHQDRVQKINGLCTLGKDIVFQRELEKLITLLAEIWKNTSKIQFCNRQLYEVYNDKSSLESDVRKQLERIIYKICDENLKFKMIIFKRALQKPVYKREQELWNDLKSL